jgi:inner membrane protein
MNLHQQQSRTMTDITGSDPTGSESSNAEPTFERPRRETSWDYTGISISKILMIAGIALATIIPNTFIIKLIEEREARQAGVRHEFARNWGPEQSVYSPTLVIPYQSSNESPRQYLKIAPERVDVVAAINPQQRKRGLFHATVYETRLELQGVFVVPAQTRLRDILTDKKSRLLWGESAVAFGSAASLTGLRSTDSITIDGVQTTWRPCSEVARQELNCRGATLVLANAPLAPAAAGTMRVSFKAVISLRGTGSLAVQSIGKDLGVTMRSPWPSPSFGGNTLPATSTVTPEGFEAVWQTTELGSPRMSVSAPILDPAMWKNATIVAVDLIEATPIYRMINRVAKYGLLFVALSFATYFFFEVLSRLQIHVVQYGLLGLSLSLFSLLLLSLAEPIGYIAGYLVSAGLVLVQSTLYTAAVARRLMPTLLFAGMLTSLFAFLYVLLGLETYSLLIGALALFAVVSALMALIQMVRWTQRPIPHPVQA